MSEDDRDLEALLRRALRERADLVQPAGDGLAKIQERAARRRRRTAWLRPGIAVVAAALAVLAAVGIPALVNRSGSTGQDAASQAAATPRGSATRTMSPKTAAPSPSAQQPGAESNRAQSVPLWPYPNSTQAIASAGTNQELRDPAALAEQFVNAFVSVGAPLTPELLNENGKTATVRIVRNDLGQRAVCTVQLQRVAANSPAYVVTAAQTDRLTMKLVGSVRGKTSVMVAGTLQLDPRTSGSFGNLYSAVLLPDGSTQSKRMPPEPGSVSKTQPDQSWSARVNTPKRITRPGIVAAWTVDLKGRVLDFAAQPAR